MKKIFYFAFVAVAGLLLYSCEPKLIEGPDADEPIAASELHDAFVIEGQYADAACTTAQADGNYIKYYTSPARTVQVYNYKSDGSKNVLATGAAGVFNITPKRGQSSQQTYYVSTINQDASVVSFENSVDVYVPADLPPEIKILAGESGEKAWKWYTIDGACWGNAGYIGVGGQADVAAGEIPGKWWGCPPEDLETEQIDHTGGTVYGYGDSDAYMVFNEDGDCISYRSDGTQIAKGTYQLNDYVEGGADDYLYGTLVTTDAPILMPFAINTGGTRVNEFEVIYMDPNLLSLICNYAGHDQWAWAECTWWRFKNASDPDAALAGSGQRAWTYYPIDGATWGNAGYIGVGGQADVAAGEIPGKWWGCMPEELETSQIDHTGGTVFGYGSDDAYMVFDNSLGTVTSYDADGNAIASSSYSIENFDWTGAASEGYKMGDLVTDPTASGILYPFVINEGGTVATEYEILYVDANMLSLICNYAGHDQWAWAECTWWRFQPKK